MPNLTEALEAMRGQAGLTEATSPSQWSLESIQQINKSLDLISGSVKKVNFEVGRVMAVMFPGKGRALTNEEAKLVGEAATAVVQAGLALNQAWAALKHIK